MGAAMAVHDLQSKLTDLEHKLGDLCIEQQQVASRKEKLRGDEAALASLDRQISKTEQEIVGVRDAMARELAMQRLPREVPEQVRKLCLSYIKGHAEIERKWLDVMDQVRTVQAIGDQLAQLMPS